MNRRAVTEKIMLTKVAKASSEPNPAGDRVSITMSGKFCRTRRTNKDGGDLPRCKPRQEVSN